MTFGFGSSSTSAFGAKPASTGNLFGSTQGFGAKTTASGGLFGSTQGFGTKTTAASGGLFGSTQGFGVKTTSSGGLFGSTSGFGAKSTASGGLFGSTQGFGTKTTASSGGLFGNSTGFGAKTTTASTGGLFGSSQGFGAKPLNSTGLFSTNNTFNLKSTTNPSVNNTNQQQTDPKATELLATATSLTSPVLFGDDRDKVIAKWNMVQAFWGTGRGFYQKDGSCVNYTPQNYFSRFKAVGYSLIPTVTDDRGLVSLLCNKKQSEMQAAGSLNICGVIHKIMGSNNSLSVAIESIEALPDDKCEVNIYVNEQSTVTGATRRVFATELHKFLQQNNIKQQLQQQLAMEGCVARVAMSAEQINQLLSNPPAGIDPVIWEQAKIDNPDPTSIITVPMLGFNELRKRREHQEMMAKQHQTRLDILSKGLERAKHDLTNTQSKIDLHKRKFLELSHRLLQVVIMQEIIRKSGLAIQPEEELLKVKLEKFVNELNAPMKYRGRLNELLSQTRMHQPTSMTNNTTVLDHEALNEIRKHLKDQQEGLHALVTILKNDFRDLNVIEKHLSSEPHSYQ